MSVINAQRFKKYASHEVETEDTITVRPSATSILAIDSEDRYPNFQSSVDTLSSPYDFLITRTQNVFNGYFHRLALTEFVFPYYIPNVNAYTNQLYFKKNGGATVTITIPDIGFYSPSELASAVQTLLQANGLAAATVVYVSAPVAGVVMGSFLIDTNTADTIQFIRGTADPNAVPVTSLTNINRFQLFDMMGLDDDVGVTSGGSKVSLCRPIEYIDVVCSQLTYNQKLKDAASSPVFRDIIARIYIENEDAPKTIYKAGTVVDTIDTIPGTYPFTIHRQFATPKQIMWKNDIPIGSLRFELFDNHGNPLDAGYEVVPLATNDYMPDWKMTLLVSEN